MSWTIAAEVIAVFPWEYIARSFQPRMFLEQRSRVVPERVLWIKGTRSYCIRGLNSSLTVNAVCIFREHVLCDFDMAEISWKPLLCAIGYVSAPFTNRLLPCNSFACNYVMAHGWLYKGCLRLTGTKFCKRSAWKSRRILLHTGITWRW